MKRSYLYFVLVGFISILVPLTSMATYPSYNKLNDTRNPEAERAIEFFRVPHSSFKTHLKLNENSITDFMQNYVNTHSKEGFSGTIFTLQCPYFNQGKLNIYTAGHQSQLTTQAVTEKSLFQIASITKSFVSIVILQLEADENIKNRKGEKFNIDNTLDDIFEENQFIKWRNVSVRQILNMTACIPGDWSLNEELYMIDPYKNRGVDDLLGPIKDKSLECEPGSQYSYSNDNYVLAGQIVEKLTKKSIETEIKDRILQKLNMKNTYYITHIPKTNIPRSKLKYLMSGYYNLENRSPSAQQYFKYNTDTINYSMSWGYAAAALTSNVSDLSKYAHAIFSQKIIKTKQFNELITLVDRETAEPLITGVNSEHPFGYGLGLIVVSGDDILGWQNSTLYGHAGVSYGFQSTWYYIPERDIFFALSINAYSGPESYNQEFTPFIFEFIHQNCF